MYHPDSSQFDEVYPHAAWRVVVHPPQAGPLNMAIDEAIVEGVASGQSPPTLRFYAWQPGCLSLGRSQPASDVDLKRIHAHGWQIVRRPTGGRAILHIDEVTYSIVLPLGDPRVAGNVPESYRRLSAGLLHGLQRLGLATSTEPGGSGGHRFKGPICFEVPSDYEITANGKKLIGSAQSRREGVVLQHGSLPLMGDITRICDALSFSDASERDEARKRLAARALTLQDALGKPIDPAHVVDALMEGFSEALNLALQEAPLTETEQRCAEILWSEKYTSHHWTFCR